MLANLREKSSLYNPKCHDCFLRFKNNTNELGCVGLTVVPDGECRFHKTFEEQQQSNMRAARRNGMMDDFRKRIHDLRIF